MTTQTYSTLSDVAAEGEVTKVPLGDLMMDVGATGLKRAVGVIDEEFLPALRGRKGVEVFREMSLNDPTIGSLLFTIEMLLRQVDWTVVGDDNSPEQSEAVQFLEECMDDMSHSWDDLIAEILSCLIYGWSFHEIVYKKRVGPWETDARNKSKFTDGKIGWRKMPIRAQETLHRWIFDPDGGIKGMSQIAPPLYQQKDLSIEKGLLFRTGTHKGNPEGKSILRNAYRPWYFKKRLEEFEAIGVERDLAGLPVARVPSEIMKKDASPDKKALYGAFKTMVKNIRRDEHEGVVLPSDVDPDTKTPRYDFELLAAGGSRTFDTNAMIERCELNMLTVVLADFIKVGHEGTGSYALHVDKTGIFRAALNTMAGSIADVFNRHAIPRLFALNDWKLDRLPRIEPSNVDPPNLGELAQFMTSMAGLGMTFFPDPDLEKFLREVAHIPALSEEDEELRREMADEQNAQMFMESKMQGEGMAQQHDMVAQGMSPDQAMMASQTPTPEMAANDPQMQAQQQKASLDQQAAQQKLQTDAAASQQQLQHAQQTHEQTLKQTKEQGDVQRKQGEADLKLKMKQMQMEIEQMRAKMGMERQAGQQKLKTQQEADKAKVRQIGSAPSAKANTKSAKAAATNRAVKKSAPYSDNPFWRP